MSDIYYIIVDMPKLQKLVNYWLPPILWALVIFSFSSMQVTGTVDVHWKDFIVKKTAHLVEYGILAVLLYRALINSNLSKQKALFFAILIAGLYGISDELHQSFTPGREPRVRDVLIDTVGATIGASVWNYTNNTKVA